MVVAKGHEQVQLRQDGSISLGNFATIDQAMFREVLKEEVARHGNDLPISLEIDRNAPYASMLSMLESMRASGLYRFSILVESPSASRKTREGNRTSIPIRLTGGSLQRAPDAFFLEVNIGTNTLMLQGQTHTKIDLYRNVQEIAKIDSSTPIILAPQPQISQSRLIEIIDLIVCGIGG